MFPVLPCLAEYCVRGGRAAIKAAISPTHLAVITTKKATFIDKYNSEQIARGSEGFPIKAFTTRVKFCLGTGSCRGGKILWNPFRKNS